MELKPLNLNLLLGPLDFQTFLRPCKQLLACLEEKLPLFETETTKLHSYSLFFDWWCFGTNRFLSEQARRNISNQVGISLFGTRNLPPAPDRFNLSDKMKWRQIPIVPIFSVRLVKKCESVLCYQFQISAVHAIVLESTNPFTNSFLANSLF